MVDGTANNNFKIFCNISNAAFNDRYTLSSVERVKALATVLSDTEITNYDFKQVIETKGKNVFFFLDPPYYSATKSALYGKNGNMHKTFNHERFANVLKETKHKWLITYDDSKYIRELFSFANITAWDLTYGMRNVNKNGNQTGKELFISNYVNDITKGDKQLKLFNEKNLK
ncbi:MAG: DNA adenine methylase [Bacteroidales bacterium]|nr:DNA adenine methylase [Bacteroidales bacterium]